MTAEDLRKSILQQAIQGKLVPQEPTDEPASVLLARIREEKARLIKEKKIKKDKNESLIYRGDDNSYYEKFADGTVKCIDEEIPFEIPQGWEWANIGSLFFIQTGASFKKEQAHTTPKGIRILRGGNILPNYYTFKDDDLFVDPSLVSDSILLQKNDLITPAVTSIDNIGKMARITESYTNVSAGGFVFIMRGYLQNDVLSEYLCAAIQSPYVTNSIKAITKKSGSAFYNIGKERLVSIFIPIPPIEEQQRIVDRINLLLTHVDKYKAVYSLITSLENSVLPSIKKSILQYAIQGKLVPQNPGDEPASELLKRIEEEKARLVKAGKIKRDKNASVIFKGEDNKYFEKKGNEVICIDDELPFEIPESWMWSRLGNCCTLIGGYAFKSHEIKSPHGHRVIRISDISDEGLVDNNIVRYNGSQDLSKYQIIDSDILIAMTGGTVGKSMLYARSTDDVLLLNQRVAIIRSKLISPQYIYAFIRSPYIKEIIDNAKNSTNDNISMADISSFLIPLPPLNEQKRIVEALDNVLASIMRN